MKPLYRRRSLSLALLAAGALSLAACQDDAAETAEVVEVGSPTGNPLLSQVPADTPYFFGNFERSPEPVVDAWMQRAEPMLTRVQEELTRQQQMLADSGEAPDDDDRLLLALLQELDGKLNADGLQSLGIDLRPWQAVYGIGAFPVIRTTLADADALRQTVARIAENAGRANTRQSLNDAEYWRFTLDDTDMAFYAAILDDQFVVSLMPEAAEAEWLPRLLDQGVPDRAVDVATLQQIAADYSHLPYSSGYLDITAMVEEFINPESTTYGYIAAMSDDWTAPSDQCAHDMRRIAAKMPRMTAGATVVETDRLGNRFDLDLSPELATGLSQITVEMPPATAEAGDLMSLSIGLSVAYLRDFLVEQLSGLEQQPFECEWFLEANQGAQEARGQLQQPLMPMIANLRGIRLGLDSISMADTGVPTSGRGVMAIQMDQPQMLVGMAQMFLPQLAEMNLQPNADPVQLPEELAGTTGAPTYLAVGDKAVGVSVGEGEQSGLLEFLNQPTAGDGTVVSFSYNPARMAEIEAAFDDSVMAFAEDDESLSDEERAEIEAMQSLSEDVNRAWNEQLERISGDVRVTDRGLTMTQDIVAK